MSRVILHIGQSKTGTTAIQHFLAANRDGLRQAGVLYPDIRNRGMSLGATDHNLVAWALIGKKSRIGVPIEDFMSDVERELKQDSRLHTVILSAEAFMGEPHIWEFESEADWRNANTAKIETLRQLLRDHEVSVFAYLRRQDYWVNSAFNHIVKTEGLVGRRLYPDIASFVEHVAPRLDYGRELEAWAQHFGSKALIIRPYEKAKLIGGDAVLDFCARVGLAEIAAGLKRSQARESANLGLPRDVFEVKRILNRIPKSKPDERVLIWALQRIGVEMPSRCREWDSLLTSAERLALVSRFDETNSLVASRYSVSDDAVLFREPAPTQASGVAYPGLQADRASEVMLRLLKVMNSYPARRLRWRYLLGDWTRRKAFWAYLLLRPLYKRLI